MPSSQRRFPSPHAPASENCQTAHIILCKAVNAAESFHVIFRTIRDASEGGTSTDAQQDVLRAMLVFACAGLDSTLKQLVRDALPEVIKKDQGAQKSLTESVKRKLPDIERSRDLLASVLTASLQSVAQFSKVAAAFDIKSNDLINELKEAFDARNQIIHEMDINFGANRSRRPRRRADMERLTKVVLDAAASPLARVDAKLTS